MLYIYLDGTLDGGGEGRVIEAECELHGLEEGILKIKGGWLRDSYLKRPFRLWDY